MVELREQVQREGTEPRPEESRDWLSSYAHAEMIMIISFVYCIPFLKIESIRWHTSISKSTSQQLFAKGPYPK